MSAVEKAILGAALATPELALEVTSKLNSEDFFEPRHHLIHQALTALVEQGKPTDAVSVASQLGDDATRAGGAPYMFELIQAGCVAQSLPHHIETQRGAATSRRLETAGERIRQLAVALPPLEAVQEAQTLIDGLTTPNDDTAAPVGAHLADTLGRLDEIQTGTAPQGLLTGFHDLDQLTNGFQGGQMIIVAARPGLGKSTLAVDFMRNTSIKQGMPSLIFSLEMSAEEINQRILAAESDVRIGNMRRKGGMTQEDWARINDAAHRIEKAPLIIDDSPENTIMDIVAKTKMRVKRDGVKLVVVDYLQLLKSAGNVESRQQEVSNFSRQLKLLAKSCNVPVIAVAQLNREAEKRGDDAKPKPSDLRESGALEQDADIILLIHRPEVNNPDHARAGEADLIVGKNRGGQMGTAVLGAQMHYSRFTNLAKGF